ncbi:MAG: glycosyltransferase [Bacillota bacterium]
MPKVSILMGIYNCEKTLAMSIDSLLAQTFKDWELIMCDDGSTDHTLHIAVEYAERYENIKILKNDKNMGLNHTLNRCANAASGEYLARQDGDDLSMPDRLEKEVVILDENPDYSLVSTEMAYFDEEGEWGTSHQIEKPEKSDFVAGSPFCHAPCMMRRSAFEAVGGYSVNNKLIRVEDYHLWFKLYAAGFKGYNILEPLYKMLDDRNAIMRRKYRYRINEAYVRFSGYKMLKLPLSKFIYVLRPLVVGVLPYKVYKILHKRRMAKNLKGEVSK